MSLRVLQVHHCVQRVLVPLKCPRICGLVTSSMQLRGTMESLSCPLTPEGAFRVMWPKLLKTSHDFVCPLRVTLLAARKQQRNKGIKDMSLGKHGLTEGDIL